MSQNSDAPKPPASDKGKGLYKKFNVSRSDGRDAPGEKHERCRYFVIDIEHDKYAIPALEAYAQACWNEFPLLARDLHRIIEGKWRKTDPRGEGPSDLFVPEEPK